MVELSRAWRSSLVYSLLWLFSRCIRFHIPWIILHNAHCLLNEWLWFIGFTIDQSLAKLWPSSDCRHRPRVTSGSSTPSVDACRYELNFECSLDIDRRELQISFLIQWECSLTRVFGARTRSNLHLSVTRTIVPMRVKLWRNCALPLRTVGKSWQNSKFFVNNFQKHLTILKWFYCPVVPLFYTTNAYPLETDSQI